MKNDQQPGYPTGDAVPTSTKSLLAEAVREYAEDPDRLFNDKFSSVGVQREKPEHRIIVELKIRGFSHREIAQATGYTPQAISYVVRQPWARQRIVLGIAERMKGADPAMAILANETVNNLQTLIDIRDGAFDAEPSTRAAAANALLDRVWGKPTQKVETKLTRVSLETVQELEREEARLSAEEARLLGTFPGSASPDRTASAEAAKN